MNTYYTYFRYGIENFDPANIEIDLGSDYNLYGNKPNRAWWGSPVDAEIGWKEWCEGEDFATNTLKKKNKILWTLPDSAKILFINYDTVDDPNIPWLTSEMDNMGLPRSIDYSKVAEEYDAVELQVARMGHVFFNESFKAMQFNGWDCESIAVLHPEKIIWETK